MGRFNGAKAQQKRERNLKKHEDDNKGGGSQKEINQKALNIQCKACFSTFMCTTKRPELEQHATNKHSKSFEECFPDYDDDSQEKVKKEVQEKKREEKK